jgi:hypothetical protein
MLKIRGMSNAENLLTGVKRFSQGLTLSKGAADSRLHVFVTYELGIAQKNAGARRSL